jgi:hypothetical protein
MLHTASDDPDLRGWVDYQSQSGSDFVRSIARAAQTASVEHYSILRPTLVALRSLYPEPGSTIRTLVTDLYKVTYNDSEYVDEIQCAFNRYRSTIFNNEVPETSIRYASSIQNLRAPGKVVGLLALPQDPVSHPFPGQLRVQAPHIFISEKLRGVSPLDEWVLLHEMCHFRVANHGKEFVEVLKYALERIEWNVLLGGY